jgi:hypothetical protein
MEKNTKIAVAVVVGGVLALFYRNYNKKNSLNLGVGTSANAEERSAEESSQGTPMGGGGGGGGIPTSTTGGSTSTTSTTPTATTPTATAPTANTPVLTREPNVEWQVPLTQLGSTPIMTTRPAIIEAKPIATMTVQSMPLSRFSGFQGGSDYVEVGSQLNDLN